MKPSHVLRHSAQPGPLFKIQFDGGSRGNPGIAGSGCVLYDPCEKRVVATESAFLPHATNNVAEYTALLIGLRLAARHGVNDLMIEGDSKLVVEQVKGAWKVNHPALASLHRQIREVLERFRYVTIRHIPRAENSAADRVANAAMDKGKKADGGAANGDKGTVVNDLKDVAWFFGNLDFII